jgi:hypothetical protein
MFYFRHTIRNRPGTFETVRPSMTRHVHAWSDSDEDVSSMLVYFDLINNKNSTVNVLL